MVTEDPIAGPYPQSVVRALRLVDIAGGRPVGYPQRDVRALGTSKSSTLARPGRWCPVTCVMRTQGGLHAGTALLRLGDIVGRQLPLGDLCRPLIEDLSRATRMTARGAVNDEGYAVFASRVDGPGGVRFYTPLGRRELPNACAAGKAILSTMDEDGIRRMCAEVGLAPRTAHTITDIETMLDNLAVARRRGFAVDDEEASEGVICVGAAFFGHDGACAGAVSVTGIKGDLPARRIGELGRAVRSCADDVSGILRGSPWRPRAGGPGLSQRRRTEMGRRAAASWPGAASCQLVGSGSPRCSFTACPRPAPARGVRPGCWHREHRRCGPAVIWSIGSSTPGRCVEVHAGGRDAFLEQFLAGPLEWRIGHRAP